jgi:hypothetical protein
MKWIDEMFATMETDRAAASAKRSAKTAKADGTEHLKKQIPGALDAWSALVSSITNDVGDFNKHKKRAGQTAVRVAQRGFHCEVYLPGMHGKRLVLTLDNNDLQVSVHPDFPKQPLTITIEPDKDGQHGLWVLGEPTKESGQLSVQQLSEYLLKPILASGDINKEP